MWHHICVSWENSLGSWKFYKDGELEMEDTNLKKDHTIRAQGSLVLGQEQDSVGGTFQDFQSFQGMLSNLNVWDQVLTATQIQQMSQSCLSDEAADHKVYKWIDFLREGKARLVQRSTCEPMGMGMCQFNTCTMCMLLIVSDNCPI